MLDANVLHSNLLRGLFLWLSKFNLCRPVWSSQIWDEVFRNYPGDEAEKRQFKNAMEKSVLGQFPASMRPLADGYEKLGLPDPDDEHVVALARQERVATVVTFNLRDFPVDRVEAAGVSCVHPDEFLCDLYEAKKDVMKATLSSHLQNLTRTKPMKTAFIENFKRAGVPKFSASLAEEDAAGKLFPEVWP